MKKFMAAAGLIFAAMLLSFGAQAEAAKPKVMKVGLVTARDTAQAKALELFIKEVEQKSGGAIKGELFADAQLGGTREMIEALQSNIIQGYVGGAADLAPFVPSFNALELHRYGAARQLQRLRSCRQNIHERASDGNAQGSRKVQHEGVGLLGERL